MNMCGVTIGALPERLGSFGTAKLPHIIANTTKIPNASINDVHPSVKLHAHIPETINAIISRRNLTIRFTGCEPILILCLIAKLNENLK